MRDEKISLPRILTLHPAVVDEVRRIIEAGEATFPENISVRVTEALRTFEYQNGLYQKGRTTQGPRVTDAPAGTSFHNYGLAFDAVIINNGKIDWNSPYWMVIVNLFKNAGWTWGGDFKKLKDSPHLQKAFGHGNDYKYFLNKYNNEQFIPNTKYIQL